MPTVKMILSLIYNVAKKTILLWSIKAILLAVFIFIPKRILQTMLNAWLIKIRLVIFKIIIIKFTVQNSQFPYSYVDPTRMWNVNTCFSGCSAPADCLTGFDFDTRQECNSTNRNNGMYCLLPDSSPCEVFEIVGETCYDSGNTICVNWKFILISIVIGNCFQILFEGSLLFTMELTFKPTGLDKIKDPEKY